MTGFGEVMEKSGKDGSLPDGSLENFGTSSKLNYYVINKTIKIIGLEKEMFSGLK